jgi:hypothetical protein
MLITPMFHGQCWGLPQAAVLAAAKIVLPGRYTADDPGVLVDAMIAEQAHAELHRCAARSPASRNGTTSAARAC